MMIMKMTFWNISVLLLLFTTPLFSQSGEFQTHPNGLIYSVKTMEQLGKIVDSLNLQFKNCELDKAYTSIVQGRGTYFEIDSKLKRKAIFKDLANNLSFNELVEKYNDFLVEETHDLLLVANNRRNKKEKPVLQISSVPINFGYYNSHQFPNFTLSELTKKELKYVYAKTKQGVLEVLYDSISWILNGVIACRNIGDLP